MSEGLVAAVLEAIPRNAASLGWNAAEKLILALSQVEESGDADAARVALGALASRPRVLTRMDLLARRGWWYPDLYAAAAKRMGKRLRAGRAGPVGIALASTHRDGHVRELAVQRMLEDPRPDLMLFLVLRTADWVSEVRDRARIGLALLLHDDLRTYLVAAVEMAVLVDGRSRGSFTRAQVLAAASLAPRKLWDSAGTEAGRAARRIAFDAAVFARALPLDELVRIAERDSDPVLSGRAAEVVCREAVWTNRTALLARLARCRRARVRGLAVTGLVRVGQVADAVAFLDDPSPLLRALARDAARRTGVDALDHYARMGRAGRPSIGDGSPARSS